MKIILEEHFLFPKKLNFIEAQYFLYFKNEKKKKQHKISTNEFLNKTFFRISQEETKKNPKCK